MGHKLKDRVREAYFLADPDELRKIYVRHTKKIKGNMKTLYIIINGR